MDVYLQPHSDDICFSLGALAHKQHRGILLTVLPISAYVPVPAGGTTRSSEEVTAIRVAEDVVFAGACGLDARFIQMKDASLLGHRPFDLGWVDENMRRIETPLLDVLLGLPSQGCNRRSWLFCPIGIGGHVDHVAIRMAVSRMPERLARRYRIAYYEDLHYASQPIVRKNWISDFLQAMQERRMRRHAFPFGDNVADKLALIHHYRSQFLEMPQSIAKFTPAAELPASPHEAVWTDEPAE